MTDTEGKNEQEKLLTSENDDTPSKELDMLHFRDEDDGWKSYSKFSKLLLFFFFFWIGIINHLGTILVMNGGRILAMELGVGDLLTLYTSGSTVFAILTRLINSKLCLKVSYKKRVWIICFWMMAGYITMYAVLELHSTVLSEYNILCFVLSFIPCFFLGSSYAFGEAAMVAYLRLFPKTLLAGWSSGTGLSGLVSGSLNFVSQLIDGFSLEYLYLILVPVGFVYLLLFICTFRILKSQERKMQREERMSKGHMTIIRDSSNNKNNTDEFQKPEEEYPEDEYIAPEEEKDQKSIREAEDRDMEEMNKANQVISLQNFKKVMGMVGRVIIKYTENNFQESYLATVGIDFKVKTVTIKDKPYKLFFYDTTGQEKYKSIAFNIIKTAHGVILIYDITDKASFNAIPEWITSVKESKGADFPMILCGNKIDLEDERKVFKEDGEDLANEYKIDFFEISNKDGNNVEDAGLCIVNKILEKRQNVK